MKNVTSRLLARLHPGMLVSLKKGLLVRSVHHILWSSYKINIVKHASLYDSIELPRFNSAYDSIVIASFPELSIISLFVSSVGRIAYTWESNYEEIK